ncbi:MAG: hypothetical protein IJR87_01115 [Bacteroidaceae bacterium]|nr:hypothetical protein [Bacteroidaceae bacterium]
MKKMLFVACMLMIALAACDKPDGDWDPIKFTKNPLEVPAQGGTVQTQVRNYSSLWLLGVSRDGKEIPVEMPIDEAMKMERDMFNLKTAYITVHSQGQTVTITVEPSLDGKAHQFLIHVEYGDAFAYLTVKQREGEKR